MSEVYGRLAHHLSKMYAGWWTPTLEELKHILELNFTPEEAEVLLTLPNDRLPLETVGLDELASKSKVSRQRLSEVLERLVSRGLVFAGRTRSGERGYALLRNGYGYNQAWFWKGERSEHSKKMADLLWHFHFPKAGAKPEKMFPRAMKTWRYLPVREAVDVREAVYPYEVMQEIVKKARSIAVAHCACRVKMELAEGGSCGHPYEVCLKFDELADYLVEAGLAREVGVDEALKILEECEQAGLVHFAENAQQGVKHGCNCCGCACWTVGAIRRRVIPRDRLMATYFTRVTDLESCIGCGACAEICPVEAVEVGEDGKAHVEEEVCIGCGVCAMRCPASAIKVVRRVDVRPPRSFEELHLQVMKERR